MPAGDDRYELNVFSAKGAATYALGPGAKLVVGRGEDADIPIDDDAISRKHAVFYGGPPVSIEDLGSSNGTFMSPAARGDGKEQTADNRRLQADARGGDARRLATHAHQSDDRVQPPAAAQGLSTACTTHSATPSVAQAK